MFGDPSRYAFCSALEAEFAAVREEFDGLGRDALVPCPADNVRIPGWDVFELYSFSTHRRVEENCERCPRTTRIVESAPGLRIAGFSVLAPGTQIPRHRGRRREIRKCHLGVHIPDEKRCALRVDTEIRPWRVGECMVFGNATPHDAWNRSDGVRVVLVVEFVDPDAVAEDIRGSRMRAGKADAGMARRPARG